MLETSPSSLATASDRNRLWTSDGAMRDERDVASEEANETSTMSGAAALERGVR